MALTLAQLRDKADTFLTPIWLKIRDYELAYYDQNSTYKDFPVRKLQTPADDKVGVWVRVLADSNGFSVQALVEFDGKQYARSQGYGTGTTFAWQEVTGITLPIEETGLTPNSVLLEEVYTVIPAHEQTDPLTQEVKQIPEQRTLQGYVALTF